MDTRSNTDTFVRVSLIFYPKHKAKANECVLGCHLPIAYEMTEERKRGPYTYILDSAMTESQGNAPPNAIREVPATS